MFKGEKNQRTKITHLVKKPILRLNTGQRYWMNKWTLLDNGGDGGTTISKYVVSLPLSLFQVSNEA